jgi:hypothetical protein
MMIEGRIPLGYIGEPSVHVHGDTTPLALTRRRSGTMRQDIHDLIDGDRLIGGFVKR